MEQPLPVTDTVREDEEQQEQNENNSTSPTTAAAAALADYLVKNPISPSPPPSVDEHEDGCLAEPKEKRASLAGLATATVPSNDDCYGELILLG